MSVVFFIVFLFECSRPLRKSKKAPVVRKSPAGAVIDAATGRRFLVHLEQQMAEFLSHHGRTTAVLLIALALTPVILRAENERSATGQTDDRGSASSAPSSSAEPEQNSGADPGSTQSRPGSSNDPKATGVKDPPEAPRHLQLAAVHYTPTSSADSGRRMCRIGRARPRRAPLHSIPALSPLLSSQD
jgi:hypothetical protein